MGEGETPNAITCLMYLSSPESCRLLSVRKVHVRRQVSCSGPWCFAKTLPLPNRVDAGRTCSEVPFVAQGRFDSLGGFCRQFFMLRFPWTKQKPPICRAAPVAIESFTEGCSNGWFVAPGFSRIPSENSESPRILLCRTNPIQQPTLVHTSSLRPAPCPLYLPHQNTGACHGSFK